MSRPIKLKRPLADTPLGTIRLRAEAAILLCEIAERANMTLDECASEIILQSRDLIDVMEGKPTRANLARTIVTAIRRNGEKGNVTIIERESGNCAVYVGESYYGDWNIAEQKFEE